MPEAGMPVQILLHIQNEDPILGELEEIPDARATHLKVHNPRRRDGNDLRYLDEHVSIVLWPWHVINFVEILPGEEAEKVFGFVRE
jgi:hypothetical protein